MAKLYTPAEATALYNRCKITYDPYSYSLRDNLVLSTPISRLMAQHIEKVTFGAEQALALAIHNFHKTEPSAYILSVYALSSADPTTIANTNGVQSVDSCFCKKDNMYIALNFLSKYYNPIVIKTKGVLEAVVQMCVALSSSKSCSADLHWLLTVFEKDKYEDLHNFKRLTDALANKEKVLPIYADRTAALCQFVPAVGTGTDSITAKEIPANVIAATDEEVTELNMLYAMYSFLEVLWAVQSLPDTRLQSIIKDYFMNGSPSRASQMLEHFMDDSGNILSDVEKVIEIANPKERFNAYRMYADSKDFKSEARRLSKIFRKGDVSALIPAGIGSFIGFVETYSNTWVRVNSCKIMYNYVMKNNLLDPDKMNEYSFEEMSAGLESLTKSMAGLVPAASDEKDSSDLMDLSSHGTSMDGEGLKGATSFISPTYEALDKVKASYTDGRYEFDVKDCVDFDDEARKRYDTIANKVRLVNRVLTQKLREIKTYNTGGKQAGLPNGRLDRKAVYRYKYDGNIFYNNTYKQLESDLAFGIVLDISGSMSGRGIENGRITMIVLHETLKALGINHSIIGHTSRGNYQCTIERYQAFREDKTYHTRKNYALANLNAKSGNCDSASLFYMEKALMRTKNKDKVCLIFSDGQPTECTGTDLREQVAHMTRNGIKTIGIGINFPEIADYYKDYANGKNLTDMLNIVTKILSEYILKKKDR